MSISRNYYVIAGYDLTGWETDQFEDWKWTDEGEEFTCNQIKGNIQLFDDPMSGEYLYLGYILAMGDEYEFETAKINLNEVKRQESYVYDKLKQFINNNIIDNIIPSNDFKYEVIVFEECT